MYDMSIHGGLFEFADGISTAVATNHPMTTTLKPLTHLVLAIATLTLPALASADDIARDKRLAAHARPAAHSARAALAADREAKRTKRDIAADKKDLRQDRKAIARNRSDLAYQRKEVRGDQIGRA